MNRLKIFITDVRILVTPGKRLMQGYNMAEIQEEAANPEFRLVYR